MTRTETGTVKTQVDARNGLGQTNSLRLGIGNDIARDWLFLDLFFDLRFHPSEFRECAKRDASNLGLSLWKIYAASWAIPRLYRPEELFEITPPWPH
jgi:hypothetical protein